MAGLRRLAASINRHYGDSDTDPGGETGAVTGAAPLEVIDARTTGSVWLLDRLWQRLDVAAAVRTATDARRFTTNMERVLFALVANRAVAPMSKLSAAEWVREDAAVAGLSTMDDDHAYRAMDLLVDADTTGRVQEAVFFAVANLLNLEVDLLFFDTTSTYFERDTEDDGDDALRRYGHSKDHRHDLPQIVIGLAVTKEGHPGPLLVLARQQQRPSRPRRGPRRPARLETRPGHEQPETVPDAGSPDNTAVT